MSDVETCGVAGFVFQFRTRWSGGRFGLGFFFWGLSVGRGGESQSDASGFEEWVPRGKSEHDASFHGGRAGDQRSGGRRRYRVPTVTGHVNRTIVTGLA